MSRRWLYFVLNGAESLLGKRCWKPKKSLDSLTGDYRVWSICKTVAFADSKPKCQLLDQCNKSDSVRESLLINAIETSGAN